MTMYKNPLCLDQSPAVRFTVNWDLLGAWKFCEYRNGPNGWICVSETIGAWEDQLAKLTGGINAYRPIVEDFEFLPIAKKVKISFIKQCESKTYFF